MIFLDVNTFYAERAGGIRTYHRAKIDWFAAQARHTYYLVHPGPRHAVAQAAPNVFLVQVYGAPTGAGEGGYRVMLDYARILRLVQRVRPDVLEVGDPWLSGTFASWVRRTGRFHGLLSAFYHSDAVRTWVQPWAARPGALAGVRRGAAERVGRWFYRRQDAYDVTVVTSRGMERHLRAQGVRSVARLPFGTDPAFFAAGAQRGRRSDGTVRLLYAGRLGREKGAELLLAALPRLLDDPRVHVTVMGRGAYEADFTRIRHPRFDLRGFVGDRAEVARTFAAHDVLLAPGPHETFGLSVLEGMAAGMVVVGPDAGGTGELLDEVGSPFTFQAGDAEGFRGAVMRAVGSDLAAGAAKARELARRYGTWDDAVARMVAFYEARVEGGTMPPRDVLLSLHDVAPPHRERVERAEALFAELGVRKVTYLLVPAFHSADTCDADAPFVAWCRRPRPFAVDWLLHGFHHREDVADQAPSGDVGERLKRRYMTAGEGEFLAMDAAEADRRIARGTQVFRRTLGCDPRGFVAPAWLFNPSLGPVLAGRGIRFHEDHGGILPTAAGARPIPAPVVTWATRTPMRKRTSILGTPVLAALWRRKPLVRLAVHPHDFDHDDTVASIRRVWRSVLRRREQRLYGEVVGG